MEADWLRLAGVKGDVLTCLVTALSEAEVVLLELDSRFPVFKSQSHIVYRNGCISSWVKRSDAYVLLAVLGGLGCASVHAGPRPYTNCLPQGRWGRDEPWLREIASE